MTFVLSPGQWHEQRMVRQLLQQGAVKRVGRGRPRLYPGRLVGDKGYSSPSFRHYLRQRGIRYTIARRSNEHRGGPFDKDIYRQRNLVERLINRLKQFRRVATRSTNAQQTTPHGSLLLQFCVGYDFAYTP